MKPKPSRWPVCGRCCEVAPYSWIGEPHHCAEAEPQEYDEPYGWTGSGWTERAIRNYFEDALAEVLTGGGVAVCGGLRYPHRLDTETIHALIEVGRYKTAEKVAEARNELERQLDGTHQREAAAEWAQLLADRYG